MHYEKAEEELKKDDEHKEYLQQVGIEFNEVYLSEKTERSSEKFADLLLSTINASQPDLLVIGATVGKFSLFNNSNFLTLLDQLDCPIIVSKDFTIPVVSVATSWLKKLVRK
jgi:hypothetical protein